MIELRFCAPLDTKQVTLRRSSQTISWLSWLTTEETKPDTRSMQQKNKQPKLSHKNTQNVKSKQTHKNYTETKPNIHL